MIKIIIPAIRHIATVGPNLLASGWYGGQWVKYVGNRTVEKADSHTAAGFLILGYKLQDLDAAPYKYDFNITNMVPAINENQPIDAYGRAVLIHGGEFDFNKNVYDNSVVYSYNQLLYLNNNGILTNVNTGGPSVGIVITAPQDNNGWMGVIIKF